MDMRKEYTKNQRTAALYTNSVSNMKRAIEKCKITIKELDTCDENTKTYRPLGTA